MSSRSLSIIDCFLSISAAFFFFLLSLGGLANGIFSKALDSLGVLFLLGKLREIMLRSILEVEAVVFSLLGLVLRDLDLEWDLEHGLLRDFLLDWDLGREPWLLLVVTYCVRDFLIRFSSSVT